MRRINRSNRGLKMVLGCNTLIPFKDSWINGTIHEKQKGVRCYTDGWKIREGWE